MLEYIYHSRYRYSQVIHLSGSGGGLGRDEDVGLGVWGWGVWPGGGGGDAFRYVGLPKSQENRGIDK